MEYAAINPSTGSCDDNSSNTNDDNNSDDNIINNTNEIVINRSSNNINRNHDTFDTYCDDNDGNDIDNDEYDIDNNGSGDSSSIDESGENDLHFQSRTANSAEINNSKVDLSELLQQTQREVQFLKDECNILTEILLRKRYKNISEALPFNKRASSRKRKIAE